MAILVRVGDEVLKTQTKIVRPGRDARLCAELTARIMLARCEDWRAYYLNSRTPLGLIPGG